MIKFGAEAFIENYRKYLNRNFALIINQSSIVYDFLPLLEAFLKLGLNVKKVFFPQHGYFQDKQDNMIESRSFKKNGIEFVSLYGEKFEPDDDELDEIDTVVYDLQDTGVRVYTFVYTLKKFLEKINKRGIEFFIFDRPNPLSGVKIEGNIVEREYESLVGVRPLIMIYGLTSGELGEFFIKNFKLDIPFKVFELEGWRRGMLYDETKRFWFSPSPNMPFYTTSYVYGATVLLEATNISEGRGTTRPFELFGAPFIDGDKLSKELNSLKLPGVKFVPFSFVPQFNKWKEQLCGGVFIKVLDFKEFMPYFTGIKILKKIRELYPEEFSWKSPPYEYVYDKEPIDVIAGSEIVRMYIEDKIDEESLREKFSNDEQNYYDRLSNVLRYI